jgi:hypothetical protein
MEMPSLWSYSSVPSGPLIGSISEDALTFEAEADRRGAGG